MAFQEDHNRNKRLIQNLISRQSKKIKVEPVFFKTELSLKTSKYLSEQKYLNFSKINKIIQINYNQKFPYGYVLKNQLDEMVGFLGTIFSLREQKKTNYKYCNLHTWIVNETYRVNGYSLILPLLNEDCQITTFTPIKTLVTLYEKLGFKKLKMKYRIVFLPKSLLLKTNNEFELKEIDSAMEKKLNESELKLFKDHQHLPCLKFLIINKHNQSKNIFIIAKVKKKKYFNVLDFLYVSNSYELNQNWSNASLLIANKFKIHFCGENFLYDSEASIPRKIFFTKDKEIDICVKNLPSKIKFDTLYSELIY